RNLPLVRPQAERESDQLIVNGYVTVATSPLPDRAGNFHVFADFTTHAATSGSFSVDWTWTRCTLPPLSTWSCRLIVPFSAWSFFLPSAKHFSTSGRCVLTTEVTVALSIAAGLATSSCGLTGSGLVSTGSVLVATGSLVSGSAFVFAG